MSQETDREPPSWSRKAGAGVLVCLDCDEPPSPGRRLCTAHRNEREAVARESRKAKWRGQPCSIEGCEQPRYEMASQVAPYCLGHKNAKAAETRKKTRPHERFETRKCDRCRSTFQWSSVHPKRRFCSKDCYTLGMNEERRSAAEERAKVDAVAGQKWCPGCSQAKPMADYSPSQWVRRGGTCRDCARVRAVESYQRNKEKNRDRTRESNHRRVAKKYGMTLEEYRERKAQGCQICGTLNDLHLDHDHSSGAYRGFLCSAHNKGLGFFRDNVDHLAAAIEYLQRR